MSEPEENGSAPGATFGAFAGIAGAIGAVVTAVSAEDPTVKAWAVIGFSAIACTWIWVRRCRRDHKE